MFRSLLLLGAAIALSIPTPCQAFVHRLQIPLIGGRAHSGGKGMVTFVEAIGETNRTDGSTLVIEVNNVPLPPGTELSVSVHEREIGFLKLDKRRSGRLVLESTAKKSVPRIAPGSFITLKLPDGSTVLW